MNTSNNARRRQSRERLIEALIGELQTKEMSQIRVKDLCRIADVNRSTFYACFSDIFALAEEAQKKLVQEISEVYFREKESSGQTVLFTKLFRYIEENQARYKASYKLGHPTGFDLSETHRKLAEKYREERE